MPQPIDTHAMSYRLWRQALSGDPEGALLELERIPWEDMSVLAADLLARLYVRAARLAEAKMLWEAILRTDPSYTPAVRALNKLKSPWLVRAVAKKYSAWFGRGALLLFALYGLGVVFFGGKDSSFVLTGIATILAVLGIYMAGFFAWAYMTVDSLFAFTWNADSPPTEPGIAYGQQPARANTPAQPPRS
jgi:tetratricopeptide (TPR) repeat protein